MTPLPLRCVVDTNVCTTANGANPGASANCRARSSRALQTIKQAGHVFLDDADLIMREYRRNLSAKGQPGEGDVFLKWLMTVEWAGKRVTHVHITPRSDDSENFEELPDPPAGVRYDRSDRKFLAVAAAHPEKPELLQSFDSKWWGWRAALQNVGVRIHFLCEEEIAVKHKKKMGW